ncbi:MAG: prolyl oligopeptidase family serine peptidase [Saprospiraceae bacterium]
MYKILCISFCCFFACSLQAQQVPNQSTLQLETIMQGEKFIGYSPERIFWSEDSQSVYFNWNPTMDTLSSLYQVSSNAAKPTKVSLQEEIALPSSRGTYNKKRSHKVYSKNGDLFLLDLVKSKTTQITNTSARESSPIFSGDENLIVYLKNNNFYAWNIKQGTTTQLSDFNAGKKKKEDKNEAYEQWLEDDQLSNFDILQERKAKREARERKSDLRQADRPKTIYYGSKRIGNLRISPDLNYITYRLTKNAKAKNTDVPNYVTESGYTEKLRAREKVGSPQDTYEMGIYDLKKDTSYLVDPSQIKGIYEKPKFLKAYYNGKKPYETKFKKPRQTIIHGPVFSEDGKALVDIRTMDNKDRWIMLLDLATGKLQNLDRQHDDAWIGGPGISSWNFVQGNMGWLADNQTVWYQSETTGYSHLYTQNITQGKKKALTKGKFEILDAQLSQDKTAFYLRSNQATPHQQHFYKLTLADKKMTQITSLPGNHQVTLSPDEKQLAIRYSYSNQPWELYLMPNQANAVAKRVTNSTTKAFQAYSWRDPEIVHFTAKDKTKVPARIYRPKNPTKKGPAIIFVHGAGYLQNVHQWWSGYYREFMFHNMLADNGYTVLDIDYRASAGYGRDWRTAIYQFMGGKDLEDQIDGAQFLVDEYDIDPERIGIYGGSYGGFITLMAQFTKPGVFKSGAALRSVTDWAHYNHPYTSNILNTPLLDSLAYRKSSPIYHAEGLQDNLLILHGMIDTNVQFQDVVRLAQRLIELGKDDWEFAVFPMERHGFVESTSWTDEYKRIFKLFQQTLK